MYVPAVWCSSDHGGIGGWLVGLLHRRIKGIEERIFEKEKKKRVFIPFLFMTLKNNNENIISRLLAVSLSAK